ncbi:hypothetical protein LSTR_LSTR008068 [Laodelphax striatellus]|uniref:MADF domain-containing protein n=1 Tax=Laodelphax striatellus TaxID=195883 RepID=A0A482XLM8_LAOST|nr:hypothetical protein LSTR_LSTR008068 [Laodelphax striatellus]
MTSNRHWSKEETERLIYRIESIPELWDVNHEHYKDRNKKRRAIATLADEFNAECTEVTRKLHNLRTQLNSELRKLRKRKRRNENDDSIKSGWQFFEALSFMIPSTRFDETSINNLDAENQDGDSLLDILEIQVNAQDHPVPPSFVPKRNSTTHKDDTALDTALQILQARDDDQIFGDFVAAALRSINTPQLKTTLKLRIQRALLEVQEKDLSL